MISIVLFQPEIPPNTGNIGRLTLGTGSQLIIVGDPSFKLDEETAVKRAGLDYWDEVDVTRYPAWESYLDDTTPDKRVLITKFADQSYTHTSYTPDTHLIFGGETRGVSKQIHESDVVEPVYIPMKNTIRAYNLANSASVVLFEALKQVQPDWLKHNPYENKIPPTVE